METSLERKAYLKNVIGDLKNLSLTNDTQYVWHGVIWNLKILIQTQGEQDHEIKRPTAIMSIKKQTIANRDKEHRNLDEIAHIENERKLLQMKNVKRRGRQDRKWRWFESTWERNRTRAWSGAYKKEESQKLVVRMRRTCEGRIKPKGGHIG